MTGQGCALAAIFQWLLRNITRQFGDAHPAADGQLPVIELTIRRGRSDAVKKTLYSAIATNLKLKATVEPADIFMFMHENDYSDCSVGLGQGAMAIVQQRGPDGPRLAPV